jgi:hypothetical protein
MYPRSGEGFLLSTIEPDVVQSAIDGFRLSPQQRRLWSLIQQDSGTAYRSQCLVVIDGDLTVETLRQAVRQVVNGREILHTTFQSLPGMAFPVQVVGAPDAFAWRTVDLSAVSHERQDIELDDVGGRTASGLRHRHRPACAGRRDRARTRTTCAADRLFIALRRTRRVCASS